MDIVVYGILLTAQIVLTIIAFKREGGLFNVLTVITIFVILAAMASDSFILTSTVNAVSQQTCSTNSASGQSTCTYIYQPQVITLLAARNNIAWLPSLILLIANFIDLFRKFRD